MDDIFIVNDEQRAILETVRRFVEDEVAPRAAALDANPDPEASFSWEIVERAHEVGIRQMTLSEEYGGLGTDSLTTSMVIEELGRGDLGVSARELQRPMTQLREAGRVRSVGQRHLTRYYPRTGTGS